MATATTTLAAKVRRHGGSNRERFLSTSTIGYDLDRDLPDLTEEDVWSSIGNGAGYDADENSVVDGARGCRGGTPAPPWHAGHPPGTGGLSLAFEEPAHSPPRIVHQLRAVENGHHHRRHGRLAASSAPLGVPNWSRILRVNSAELLRSPAPVDASGDGDDEWLPPHEYLARAGAACGGTVGASVLEGAGRTLKGRDLSRVRNAVWRQTGFFG